MKFSSLLSVLFVAGVLCCTPVLITAQTESDPALQSNLSIHVVQRGENLFRIALQYETTIADLANLNGILDVNSLEVGQRLLVPASATTAGEVTHTVAPGETLSSIASFYNVDLAALLAQNELESASRIFPGQVLIISPGSAAAPLETAAPPVNNTLSAPVILHTVQANETLFRIALRYNLSVQEIAAANNISDPTRIYSGQQLIIPQTDIPEIITANLPAPITGIRINPVIFVEGETGIIEVTTSQPETLTGSFLDRPISFIAVDNGTRHIAFVGIPVFVEPNIYSFQVRSASGAEFAFDILTAGGGYTTQNLNVSAEMQGLLAPAVQENELALFRQLTSTITQDRYWSGLFSIPAAAAMNAPFGTHRSYNDGPVNTFHSGADFAAAPNTPIFAAASGIIVLADTLNIRGNTVVINHGWGIYTSYAHLTSISVQLGQQISAGDILGTAGSTGRVTGPHLHWEVWVNGIPVDPLQWIQQEFP